MDISVCERHSPPDEWIRLWHIHLQICRIHHKEGTNHIQANPYALLQMKDDLRDNHNKDNVQCGTDKSDIYFIVYIINYFFMN